MAIVSAIGAARPKARRVFIALDIAIVSSLSGWKDLVKNRRFGTGQNKL
jgi:hypothetical protein